MFLPSLTAALLAMSQAPALPPYRVDHQGDEAWLVDPQGHRFIANGVCCVNPGQTKAEWTPLNPGYSGSHHYKDDRDWAKDTASRLKSWGFNTIGAWSEHPQFEAAGLYQTPVLHLLAAGIPWLDPWDPAIVDEVRKVAKPQIERYRGVSGTFGYFSDNELGWWQAMLWEFAGKYKAEGPGRKRWVQFLRQTFPTWKDLLLEFDPEGADSFDSLQKAGRLYLKPGSLGARTVRKWIEQVADRYYQVCKQVIQEYHPGALYLGDRYIALYFPEVVRAAGRHCDVVSSNMNADWADGGFPPFYLPGLYQLAKRPIMVTEFYASAMENRSGNLNDSAEFPTVKTQAQRNALFRKQAEYLLATPYVVGVHWFQYYDEPTHGRGDGENFNMGLVDIENRPYKGLVAAARRSLATSKRRNAEPGRAQGIPFIRPSDGRNMQLWNREVAARTQTLGDPRGDAFISWNEQGLYLGFYWNEDVMEPFYRDGRVPDSDLATIKITVDSKKEIVATVGGAQPVKLEGANLLFHKLGVRNQVVARISPDRLGRGLFAAGQKVSYRIEMETRSRMYPLAWQGEAILLPAKR